MRARRRGYQPPPPLPPPWAASPPASEDPPELLLLEQPGASARSVATTARMNVPEPMPISQCFAMLDPRSLDSSLRVRNSAAHHPPLPLPLPPPLPLPLPPPLPDPLPLPLPPPLSVVLPLELPLASVGLVAASSLPASLETVPPLLLPLPPLEPPLVPPLLPPDVPLLVPESPPVELPPPELLEHPAPAANATPRATKQIPVSKFFAMTTFLASVPHSSLGGENLPHPCIGGRECPTRSTAGSPNLENWFSEQSGGRRAVPGALPRTRDTNRAAKQASMWEA